MQLCMDCGASTVPQEWVCPACGWEAVEASGVVVLAPEMIGDHDGFHEALFETYDAIERDHFWFVYRRKLIIKALNRHFPEMTSFLEIGCGTAETLNAVDANFPGTRLCGAEPSLLALQMARHKTRAQLLQMDARVMPFRDAFDVVGAFDVIEHIEEEGEALAGMYRACKPGGGIVLTVPQHPWLWSHMDDIAKHKRRYTRVGLTNAVRAAGFRPVYVNSFMSLLLPAMLASRVLQRSMRPSDGLDHGFRIGKALNAAFGRVCRAEGALLHRGMRFPAGGSLLLIARKDA